MLKKNIRNMDVSKNSGGMDIVIVACQTPEQEGFWQRRLHETQGAIVKPSALIVTVHEDWEGGAGNGLGSLYAYQKAREKAYVMHKVDIFQKQREGHSVALYHTAGEGKRLYPLTASVYGNKGATLLPSLVKIRGKDEPMTLLEATIRQTSIYAPSRRGRFSVFWADQLFIPSQSPLYAPRYHADILVKLMPMPNEEEWSHKELSKYGIITLNKQGHAQHINKTDYPTIKKLISNGKISISGGVGLSLGSFSLSTPLTFALMQEFQPELIQKNTKMDSDPYFWMPFTLDQASYIEFLVKTGSTPEEAKNHHLRLQYFKNHFLNKHPDAELFGIVDIGVGSFWWDFGNVDCYFNNLLKITQNTVEGYLLRDFFRLEQNFTSTVLASSIQRGKITSSVVVATEAEELNVENSIVIGSVFKKMNASESFFYNVLEEQDTQFTDHTVRADAWIPSEETHLKIYGERVQDNKHLWTTCLPQNSKSYEEIAEHLKQESLEHASGEFEALKKATSELVS